MKKEISTKLYDIIPAQETMFIMLKYSLHKQVMQIPTSLTVDKELDLEVLKRAVNKEIERNDCMRLRFLKTGKEIKQYFLSEYHLTDVPVKTFLTLEQQEEYLAADAQKPVRIFNDETFRVVLFRTAGKGTGIYLNTSHLIMDATASALFYLDLLAVYEAMVKGSEMPEPLYKYEDYIQKDLSYLTKEARLAKDKEFYDNYFREGGEPFYAGIHGPDLLEKERKKKKNPGLRVPNAYMPIPDKADVICRHIGPDEAKEIFEYCLETKTSPENLIQLAMRTHASKINYRVPDVFMMSLCNRRITYKEKRMGGCVAQPLQFRTILPEDMTFSGALKEFLRVKTDLYRHVNYPYLWARDFSREIYNYGLTQGPACMMFSWLPLPIDRDSDMQIDFKGYSLGHYVMPLYVLTIPNMKDKGLDFYYMYRTNRISADNIHALHDNSVKIMLEGVRNPDITIGELLDSIPGLE